MQDLFTLSATVRTDVGKGASRRLRHTDNIPAIIYGVGKPAQSVILNHKSITRALDNEAFYSHILTIVLDGKSEKVVLKDVQRHPYKPRILHVDFLRISELEKLTMNIPLHFVGGDVAPGVKVSGGLISHMMTEVEVKCLPKDLPEYIEVDLSKLEINQSVHLSELKLPAGIEIIALTHGEDRPVGMIYIPRAAEIAEVKPDAAAIAEAAATAEASKEKEAAPAKKESSKK